MEKLTSAETEVLSLYLREGNLSTVAEVLGVSIHTVRCQRTSIMRKLCVKSSIELTIAAIKRGFVHLEPKKEDTNL